MIEWTTKRRKDVKRVHFQLDLMDLARTVQKNTAAKITGQELRYIYRQYLLQLQGEEAEIDLSRVKFYLNGKEVPAPWISEPELWSQYVPKFANQSKRHSSSTDGVEHDDSGGESGGSSSGGGLDDLKALASGLSFDTNSTFGRVAGDSDDEDTDSSDSDDGSFGDRDGSSDVDNLRSLARGLELGDFLKGLT